VRRARTASANRVAGVLEDEADGTGAKDSVDVLVEVEGGDDDHAEGVGDVRAGQGAGDLDPVQEGILISITHTPGRSRRARATSCGPSAVSPTTVMSGWSSRMSRRPLRTIA